MVSTSKVHGVGPAMEKALTENGIHSAEDMAAATPEQLRAVPGIGAATAPRLIASAKAIAGSEGPAPDEKPPRSEAAKPAPKAAETGKKKAAKPKKQADKKPAKKSKDKAKKKGKGKAADKGGKKKSKKGKSGKKG